MSNVSGDPVPSVSEAEATGEIAEIYADIRRVMGMSFVNLIWRNLASIPGALSWVWFSMTPLYERGLLIREADALRKNLNLPAVSRLPRAALRAVGVDAAGEASIRAAIAGYDRGNPLNLIAFSTVLARLRNESAGAPSGLQARATRPSLPGLPASAGGQAAQSPAPKLLNFEEMGTSTAELVRSVNLIGARKDGPALQVSLPRHLANWPGFLALYEAVLRPLHDDGRLPAAIDAVLTDGAARGERLAAHLARPLDIPAETRADICASLETLVPNAMGRMIPVVSLLNRMFPEPTAQMED